MFTLGSQIVGVEDHPDNAGLVCLLAGLPPADGGGTLYDLTGNTPGATLIGGPTWSGTPYGQSGLAFTGANYAAATVPAAAGYTIAAWVRADAVTVNAGTAFGLGDMAYLTGAEGACLWLQDTGAYPRTSASAGQTVGRWTRVVITSSGPLAGQTAIYHDGRRVDDGAAAGTPGSGSVPLFLGKQVAGPRTLVGAVAGFWYWLRAYSSSSEVARDYEWSRDPQRDPRLRRTSTRSYFVTAAGVPAASFVPAFAPGWGW